MILLTVMQSQAWQTNSKCYQAMTQDPRAPDQNQEPILIQCPASVPPCPFHARCTHMPDFSKICSSSRNIKHEQLRQRMHIQSIVIP